MFSRLFGETPEEQFHYLQIRVIATLASLVLMLFLSGIGGAIFSLIMMFVWGWGAVKALFGVTSVGVIFSGNVVFGVVIFVLYVMVAYLAGIFCALLGVGRFIYLWALRLKQTKEAK